MSKRRKTETKARPGESKYGLLGEGQILKPVGNRDIPKGAQIANVNIIGNITRDFSDLYPTDDLHKSYGSIFEFEFPDYFEDPLFNEAIIPPTKLMPTNEIYDIDFEGEVKTPDPGMTVYYDEMVPLADAWTAGAGRTKLSLTQEVTAIGTTVSMASKDQNFWEEIRANKTLPQPFMVFCVGKGKQKQLGDFIEKYSTTTAAQSRLNPVTPWLFDRFCLEVRPVWAKHYNPSSDSIMQRFSQFVAKTDTIRESIPIASNPIKIPNFKWNTREFHRFQDFGGQLCAVDSYARKLLMGVLGQYNADVFNFMRFRIYYQPTKVKADTLFFQSQQEFVFEQFRGDRHEYGVTDFDGKQNERLTDAIFNGVVTCQKGSINYYKGGVLSAFNAATNSIQDSAETDHWY